jgi:hypothetical protein
MFESLHAIPIWLEDFAGRHAHSIALLEAVSTTAAVIVALSVSYAAKRANRPRLTARATISLIIYGDGRTIEDAPTYITVQLTNVGQVPIRLHSTLFSWRIPFMRNAWMAMPVDELGDEHVPKRSYPFVLFPNTSETIYLSSLERFKAHIPRILDSGRLGRKISARFVRGSVYTDDGSLFRARLSADLRAHWNGTVLNKGLARSG